MTFVENLKKSSGLSIERKVSQLVEKINGISGEEYYQLAFKRTSLNVRSKINEGISSIRDSKEEEENEESMIVENEEGTSKLDSFIPLTSHTALETILKKNEKDERLIKEYVFQGINNLEHVSDDQRESILKHLSTALELNSTSTYLWAIYFHFYIPCAPSEVDIEELFEDAIHFNPQSDILWHM